MASLAELNKKRLANLQKQRAVNKMIQQYNDAVAENESSKLTEDEAVANIERQLSEVRAANAKKAASAVGNVLGNIGGKANNAYQAAVGKVADMGESKAQRIVSNTGTGNDISTDYTPQAVPAGIQKKIDAIGTDSKLKQGTQLYKKQAELTNRYMNARTAEEQTAAKGELDALQKQLPAKGIERAVNAIGSGVVSLEAGVGKMLNPTARGGSADKVSDNINRANVTGKAGLGAVGGLMYDAVQTVSNNAAAMAAGGAVGKAVGGVSLGLMGTSVAGSTVKDAQDAGARDSLAVVAGVANGIIEAAFEKVPLDNLFKLAKVGANDKVIKDGLMGYAMSVAKQAGLEGASEGGTTIAQNFANRMIYEKSLNPDESWGEWWTDTGKEAAYAVLLGGLVGGMMGAPAAVAGRKQEIAEWQQGKEQRQQAQEEKRQERTNALWEQEKAAQAAQNAQSEEFITQAAESGESGQNAAETGEYNSWKSRYYNEGDRAYLYSRDMQRGYEIPEKQELDFSVDSTGTVSLKTALVPELNTADYKDFAKAYAARNLITEFDGNGEMVNIKPIEIAEDGKQVVITQKGVNDVLKNVRGNRKSASLLDSLFVLDDIIANAHKVGEAENKKGRVNPYTYYQSRFVDSNGLQYNVTVNIKDTPDVSRYHYHNLQEAEIKIEPFDGTSADNANIAGADLIAKGSEVNLQTPVTTSALEAEATNDSNSLDTNNIPNSENYVKGGAEDIDVSAELKQAKQLCDKLGVGLRIAELPDGMDGYYFDGVITISPRTTQAVHEVFIHELTHHLEQSGGYAEYAEFATSEFERLNGKRALLSYKQQVREAYAERGISLDEAALTNEVVAICTERLLGDKETVRRLAHYDGGVLRRVYNWLQDVRVFFTGTDEERTAAAAVRRFEAALREMNAESGTESSNEGKGQYKINPNFTRQLDEWDGKSDRTFSLGTTSEALQSIGIDDRSIVWHSEKIRKILQKHAGMSMNVIKQVPQILENPIVVLKSKQSESRVAVFGEVQDELGEPVLAALELNPNNRGGELLDLNIVASAYGKNGNVANFVKSSEILYLDTNKKRTDSWFQGLGLQLPSDKTSYGSLGSITYADGKVNIQGVPFEELANFEDKIKDLDENTASDDSQRSRYLEPKSGRSQFEVIDTNISSPEENVKGQYKISRAADGARFVDVEQNILQGKSEQEIPRVLADVVQKKFKNLIEVNGQGIRINSKTVNEWQWSKEARRLYNADRQTYDDKMRSMNNADELLEVSRNYINEELKHQRKDKFAGFARGKVDFRVGDNDYTADVVVGVGNNGSATLYDLVNIKQKKIASALYTQLRRSETGGNALATDTSISSPEENVKGQYNINAARDEMLERARAEQKNWDDEQELLREMEVEDELADMAEAAKAKVTPEMLEKNVYAGMEEAMAIREYGNKVIQAFGIPKGSQGMARRKIESYAKAELEARSFLGRGPAALDEMTDFLYAIGGMVDDVNSESNLGLLEELDSYKIFVPEEVIENIGGAKAFRSFKADTNLQIRSRTKHNDGATPYNREWARIDDVYEELQEAFGFGMFPEGPENQTARLQRLAEVRERIEPKFISWEEAEVKYGLDSFEGLKKQLIQLNQELRHFDDEVVWNKEESEIKQANEYARAKQAAMDACKGNEETGEPAVEVPETAGLDYANAQFIQDPKSGMALRNRDLTGGLELVSRDNAELAEELKDWFVRPLDAAKKLYGKFIEKEMGALNKYMESHGFKKGSKESAAVQRIGEGRRLLDKSEMVEFTKDEYDRRMADLDKAEKQRANEEDMARIKKENPALWRQLQNSTEPKKLAEARKELAKWLHDGKRPPYIGETTEYTMLDLKRDFPNNWQEIADAAEYCRDVYDRLFDKIEEAYNKIYPQAEVKAREKAAKEVTRKLSYAAFMRRRAEQDEFAAALSAERKVKYQRKLGEYRKGGKKDKVKRTEALIKQLEMTEEKSHKNAAWRLDKAIQAEESAARMKEAWKSGEELQRILRQRKLNYRRQYFHHYQEKGNVWEQTKDILFTPATISAGLAGKSEFTKPSSRFHGFFESRKGHMAYTEDAFGGLQKYFEEAATTIYIDPIIKDFRVKIAGMAQATEDTRNANQTILWLTQVTNQLAGKTNSLDRPIQEQTDRKWFRLLKLYSGRMRANSVMYNIGTFFVQFGNWANLQLTEVSLHNQVDGMADWLDCFMHEKSRARSLLAESSFMRERYLDDVIKQMDYKAGFKFDPKNMEISWGSAKQVANWLLQFGDEQVARHIWFSAYREGMSRKVANPIRYADETTRRCVAGRGIGEMALNQQSEVLKLIAPFQVEVANTWNQMKDVCMSKNMTISDKLGRFAKYFFAIWMMNNLFEAIISRRPLPDVIDAFLQGLRSDDDDGEEEELWDRAFFTARDMLTEGLSFMPFVTVGLSIAIPDESGREKILGDNDLTRYGSGNMFLERLTDFGADLISGGDVLGSGSDLLLSVALPGGASQLRKTVGAAQDLGWLPRVTAGLKDGVGVSKERGSYTAGGKLRFDTAEENWLSSLQGLAFGRYATKGGREYIKGGAKPILSKEKVDTARQFEASYGMTMGEYAKIYAAVKDLESDCAVDIKGRPVYDKDGERVRVSAGSKYERMGLGKSAALRKKERIDSMTPDMSVKARQRLYKDMGVSEKVW